MTKEMAIKILRGAVLGTNEQTHEAVFMAIKALKEQERVDAVEVVAKNETTTEVVRCKDCRWFENDGYHTNCQIIQFCVEAEDYCSGGERKDDLISRQAAIDAADDMVEPQESEG